MSTSFQIINDLYLTNRNFCSSDYDKAVSYLTNNHDGTSVRFSDGEVNGWRIPPKWDLLEAKILKEGQVIYDGAEHPLGVISLSAPFEGTVSLEELKQHLYFETHYDVSADAIPFHFRQNYQNWKRDWGFGIPKSLVESLSPGDYDVTIKTQESEGYLDILEFESKGELRETFVFVAHLDHPGMANDDLAGVAVGIELIEALRKRDHKYTYKLVVVQEIIGSEFYLDSLSKDQKKKIMGGLFLEMLGSDTPLNIQRSYFQNSILYQPLLDALGDVKVSDYGTVIGNDEIVFEAHGIPMPSLNRYPYPEYHTDLDNLDIIKESALNESLEKLLQMVDNLERDAIVSKKFEGLVCLSNPEYDLYIDLGAQGELATDELRKMRLLMDYIAYIKEPVTISKLASDFNLPQDKVLEYLSKWQEKDLIKLL